MTATEAMRDEESAVLSGWEKLISWSAWGLAAAVFLTVGWMAMAPEDPLGAVTIFARRSGVLMLIQSAGLAGITAALATVMTGRRLMDAGTFAACVGLAAVSFKGETAEYMLLQSGGGLVDSQQQLGRSFAGEAAAWFVVVLFCVVISAAVARWCFSIAPASATEVGDAHVSFPMSGFDAPVIGTILRGGHPLQPTAILEGLLHTLVAAGVTLVAYHGLSTGLATREILHGQAGFMVVAAVWIGSFFAHRLFPTQTALWTILAVGAAAILGYLWASLGAPVAGRPANIPVDPFLRALPIQFVAAGSAAAVLWFWYLHGAGPGELRAIAAGDEAAN